MVTINEEIKRPNLMLHCGDSLVGRTHVELVDIPRPTATWKPVSHAAVLRQTEKQLEQHGLTVMSEAHCLTHEDARYFGLLEVGNGRDNLEYTQVVGIRNSHDKRFSAGLVAGTAVMICSNLAFSGEIQIGRKHTRHIGDELPFMIREAIGRLKSEWNVQDRRITAYKYAGIGDGRAHDLIVQAMDRGVCPPSRIPAVLQEWRESQHEAFKERNCWSLFNAFTEVLKGRLHLLPQRTQTLHQLMDGFTGFN